MGGASRYMYLLVLCFFELFHSNEASTDHGNVGPIDLTRFHKLDDIYGYLSYLTKKYPEIASRGSICRTAEKRKLKYLRVTSGNQEAKTVVIDGGIHGSDWISVSSVTYIMMGLVEDRKHLSKELLGLNFYIFPVLNPDGYEYTQNTNRKWKKNKSKGNGTCFGVDLNRNFNTNFSSENTFNDQCSDSYRGIELFSELETKGFRDFLMNISGNLAAYITFHSHDQNKYIMYPLYSLHYGEEMGKDFTKITELANKITESMKKVDGGTYKVGETANITGSHDSGRSDRWVKEILGIKHVYSIEQRDIKDDANFRAFEIVKSATEAFEAVKVVGTAAAEA